MTFFLSAGSFTSYCGVLRWFDFERTVTTSQRADVAPLTEPQRGVMGQRVLRPALAAPVPSDGSQRWLPASPSEQMGVRAHLSCSRLRCRTDASVGGSFLPSLMRRVKNFWAAAFKWPEGLCVCWKSRSSSAAEESKALLAPPNPPPNPRGTEMLKPQLRFRDAVGSAAFLAR